ncbi:MAG: hypothetical protein ACK4PG_06445 [Acetobacteraceae bacterium]
MAEAAMAERLQRLASLWRGALSRPQHPAGCTCMGHFLIPAMNARDMESDILDFMRARYAAEGLADLVALLDARDAERSREDVPARPFRAWLLSLAECDAPSLPRFVADLTATLESFGAPPPRSGLFCT